MKQDDIWNQHIEELMSFMRTHNRRPSKYNAEERAMLHWLKYAKKRQTKGLLSSAQESQLNEILALARQVQRINQYQYHSKTPMATIPGLFGD